MLEIVEGYRNSRAKKPLVVVGSAPYSAEYTQAIHRAADGDERIIFLGGVFDQDLLDALYFHAFTYVHGHSVGGTNPSLLRAMGAGTAVIAYDVGFNRETLAEQAWFFGTADELSRQFTAVETDSGARERDGRAQSRPRTRGLPLGRCRRRLRGSRRTAGLRRVHACRRSSRAARG